MQQRTVASGYMKQILGFVGISDVNIVLVGGTLAIMGQKTLDEFAASIEPQLALAAQA